VLPIACLIIPSLSTHPLGCLQPHLPLELNVFLVTLALGLPSALVMVVHACILPHIQHFGFLEGSVLALLSIVFSSKSLMGWGEKEKGTRERR
jgi:hypothetical protein